MSVLFLISRYESRHPVLTGNISRTVITRVYQKFCMLVEVEEEKKYGNFSRSAKIIYQNGLLLFSFCLGFDKGLHPHPTCVFKAIVHLTFSFTTHLA